jgi:electron transfer flavoprotein alpha subunit
MKTFVFVEKNPVSGKMRDVSLEMTAKAHALMKPLGGEVVAVYVGSELPKAHESLFTYGANRMITALHPDLAQFQAMPYKKVLQELVKSEDPDIVLFGATHYGRELAPLLSSSLNTGLTADCTQLYIENYKDKGKILFQARPAFGGNILATIITPDHRPMMATVREGVMLLPEISQAPNLPINVEKVPFAFQREWIRNKILKVIPKAEKVNLSSAGIVVAGGAGMGTKENFAMLKALAEQLGGEVAASRAAVDFGFIEKDRMVGQTGQVVRPKLYIACGISGSVQHRAGMEESKKILAINSDPDAPIFKIAHMGIVGDVKDILPIMLKCLKEEA